MRHSDYEKWLEAEHPDVLDEYRAYELGASLEEVYFMDLGAWLGREYPKLIALKAAEELFQAVLSALEEFDETTYSFPASMLGSEAFAAAQRLTVHALRWKRMVARSGLMIPMAENWLEELIDAAFTSSAGGIDE